MLRASLRKCLTKAAAPGGGQNTFVMRGTRKRAMELFGLPAVYDTAFQFRSAPQAADFVEWCIKTYIKIPVTTVVDIACGTGHFTLEFARRQYRTYGVDINPQTCEYAARRACNENLSITFVAADMVAFTLPERCQIATSFFDSLTYLTRLADIAAHLETVARALTPGGLYIVEFGVIDDFDNHNVEEVWTETRRDFSVTSTYFRDSWINPETDTFEEQCSFRATCREHVAVFHLKSQKLALYFEDFDALVRRMGLFKSLAYFDDFDPKARFNDDFVPWRVIAVLQRIPT